MNVSYIVSTILEDSNTRKCSVESKAVKHFNVTTPLIRNHLSFSMGYAINRRVSKSFAPETDADNEDMSF